MTDAFAGGSGRLEGSGQGRVERHLAHPGQAGPGFLERPDGQQDGELEAAGLVWFPGKLRMVRAKHAPTRSAGVSDPVTCVAWLLVLLQLCGNGFKTRDSATRFSRSSSCRRLVCGITCGCSSFI